MLPVELERGQVAQAALRLDAAHVFYYDPLLVSRSEPLHSGICHAACSWSFRRRRLATVCQDRSHRCGAERKR